LISRTVSTGFIQGGTRLEDSGFGMECEKLGLGERSGDVVGGGAGRGGAVSSESLLWVTFSPLTPHLTLIRV
jgi:hypothetical protein